MSTAMNDIPREKLAELVAKYGDSLWQDKDRCEGLLKDHCGAYRKEISALTAALNERVPQEIRSSWQTAMTPEAMRARLIERLEDARGLAAPVAAWAVDTWAHVLKVPLGRISDRVDSELISPPPVLPAHNSSVSGGSVWTGPAPNSGVAPNTGAAASKSKASGAGANALGKQGSRLVAGLVVAALCIFGFYRWHASTTNKPACVDTSSKGACVDNGGTGSSGTKGGTTDSGSHPPGQTGSTATVPVTDTRASAGTSTQPSNEPAVSRPKRESIPMDVVAVGTPLRVRVDEDLSSESAQVGQFVGGTLLESVTVDGKELIPSGARAVLVVRTATSAGRITGRPELGLALYQVYAKGRPLRVVTNESIAKGPSRTIRTVKRGGIGAAAGCVVGGAIGKIFHRGGRGCGAGAGAGAAGGVVMSADSQQAPATIAAETVLSFRLMKSLDVPANRAS